jgi:hypothetical protein
MVWIFQKYGLFSTRKNTPADAYYDNSTQVACLKKELISKM